MNSKSGNSNLDNTNGIGFLKEGEIKSNTCNQFKKSSGQSRNVSHKAANTMGAVKISIAIVTGYIK